MRSARASLLLLLAAVGLNACRPDTVELKYRYPEQTVIPYRMDAAASARWDIGGQGSGSYHVVFDVTERVRGEQDGGAVVTVEMTPVSVDEDNLPSPGSGPRSFSLRIGANGEVREVLEVDGVPATALDPDELAFIGTYRPPLPLEPVGLGDEWESEQNVQVGSVFQQVVTVGELEGLRRDEDARVAALEYRGRGPLVWATELPQGEADLTGSATSQSAAEIDIDRGLLRRATSSTRGRFEVRVRPTDQQAPITGSLQLDLNLRLAIDD
jgi:hypothetical protein